MFCAPNLLYAVMGEASYHGGSTTNKKQEVAVFFGLFKIVDDSEGENENTARLGKTRKWIKTMHIELSSILSKETLSFSSSSEENVS